MDRPAFDAWSQIAPAQVAEMEQGKKVGTFGAAWHGFESGKPGNDVLAYDAFYRCAVPGIDKNGERVTVMDGHNTPSRDRGLNVRNGEQPRCQDNECAELRLHVSAQLVSRLTEHVP